MTDPENKIPVYLQREGYEHLTIRELKTLANADHSRTTNQKEIDLLQSLRARYEKHVVEDGCKQCSQLYAGLRKK
jgi:hypothetical protein